MILLKSAANLTLFIGFPLHFCQNQPFPPSPAKIPAPLIDGHVFPPFRVRKQKCRRVFTGGTMKGDVVLPCRDYRSRTIPMVR